MKRGMSVAMVLVLVGGFAAVATAQPGWGPMMGGGNAWMAGRMGGGPGFAGGTCPGLAAAPGGAPAATAVTEEKATALATEYAAKYFKGYTVERVLPFEGRRGTAYQVEMKGPGGEKRILHVNPWGGVRPFGPLAAAE